MTGLVLVTSIALLLVGLGYDSGTTVLSPFCPDTNFNGCDTATPNVKTIKHSHARTLIYYPTTDGSNIDFASGTCSDIKTYCTDRAEISCRSAKRSYASCVAFSIVLALSMIAVIVTQQSWYRVRPGWRRFWELALLSAATALFVSLFAVILYNVETMSNCNTLRHIKTVDGRSGPYVISSSSIETPVLLYTAIILLSGFMISSVIAAFQLRKTDQDYATQQIAAGAESLL